MKSMPFVFLVITIGAGVGALPPRAFGQDAPRLSLAQAVEMALKKDPSLELAAAAIARAQSNEREARSSRLPSLQLDGNVTRFAQPMVVAPLHGFDPRNPPQFDRTLSQGSAQLFYSLFDASRGARIDRTASLVDAAETGEAAARSQLLADVTRGYLRLASMREVAQAHGSRVTALERERERTAQLVREGRAARVAELRAEAALSAARAEKVSANSDVEVAANELARQLGVAADSVHGARVPMVHAAPQPAFEVADLRAAARENNPQLERLRRQIAAAEAGLGEARGLWLPRLQLGGRFIEYASSATRPQGEWQGAIQLSYPVFTGGARLAANDRASAELRAARAEYELAARRLDDAIDRALSALHGARARMSALAAAVAQSEEVVRIDRLALETGAGVQSDYLNAEADLFRARASLTDARAAELIAMVELARLTDQLSERWLADHVESFQ